MGKVLVTTALAYTNGPLHIGHVRSTYLPADVYTRFLKMRGIDAIHIGGTDNHGVPIALQAELEGKDPEEIVEKYHEMIKEDLERLNIHFDEFSCTCREFNPDHVDMTQWFFKRLYEAGYIEEREVEQLYCPECERPLPDRYVEGVCPYCGAEGARGDHCEACGRYLEPVQLEEPRCVICGSKPEVRRTMHLFFKLSEFEEDLKKWLESNDNLPKNVRNYAIQWVREGLKDWDIVRDLDWGVPVPLEGYEDKVFYVWFDAPIGYVTFTKQYCDRVGQDWKDYWFSEDTKIVHFIGKDIIVHHALFWPAMLMGVGATLPYTIVAGEYLTLEGEKMSTSRGWVVWVKDFTKLFPADLLRYYLIVVSPLTRDADFSWGDFRDRVNNELVANLGNFVYRTLSFIYRFLDGNVPEAETDQEIVDKIKETHQRVTEHLEKFRFREALTEVLRLSKFGNEYFQEHEPWKLKDEDPERCAEVLRGCARIVKALAVMLAPFLPDSAEKIWQSLGYEDSVHDVDWEEALEDVETKEIPEPEPIFPKVTEEDLEKAKALLPEESGESEGQDDEYVSLEEFNRLDLRVGKIKEAERVEGSDRLIKLRIDIGDRTVTAVAGLYPTYEPEELVGRKVVVLANIQPKEMFGVRSEAMILAVGDEPALLTIDESKREVEPGERIR
ncbi:methionine--tRNA ligase [Methanopyrus kandleri]|uniref:Methionine--tRNA ligase n=2 Tax=Methanopyrus kandleri TaxID=2320 RepID=SYM_METKA|nr:methionine--tRNA ligase [Methanopyrus kandleri]Q8TX28.1 RecName: Full=Methionine--tRNA ligase; AltName: Full=Methionyl-tRNA synthetase; Short=MetRS [Methanopyrus kandleri AV19]AAM02063.1 Methionyl-tRNA synthetase [Methanopyrus kandleri AV19]HII69922.1 methionine--tRNA ligase [Methanopyrus kandleri]